MTVGFSLAILAALGGNAAASPALRPPAGTPDPKLMVLTSGDLHMKAKRQRYFKDRDFPSVISYERDFEGGRAGSIKLIAADNIAEIGTSARTTARFVAFARRYYGSKEGRAELKRSFGQETGDPDFLLSDLRIGRVRSLGAGAGSFDLPMTVSVLGLESNVHFAVFRVDRILGALFVVGEPGARLPTPAVTRLARVLTSRMARQLVPQNVTVPVVAGVAEVGQALTASSGTWRGIPSSFTYRWQRCDATGGSCTGIADATSQTYVLTTADAASTIRVSVTARNSFGTVTARSAATSPVSTAAGPTNTVLPTITGTAQVGQMLSATTGSWTGDPTGFSFQWQSCDVSGSSCVPIGLATGGAYVVAGSDAGKTLRVAVTATNGGGSATAVSPPTAPVP
jgi:hypothetical protein